jgi:5'-nucleotidase
MPRATVLLSLAFALGYGGCTHPSDLPYPKDAIHLTIVGTNDVHGWIDGKTVRHPDGTTFRVGGGAVLSGYLDVLRAQNPGGVILLDAGDLFQGTLLSNLSEGEPVIAAYNEMGYDAVAVGNHEFDYGPIGPVSVALNPNDDPFGALAVRCKQAKFPFLGRNIYDKTTGKRPPFLHDDGVAIIERKGVKVGVVGLITPSTPTVTNPVNVRSLRFGDLAPEAISGAADARAKGAEIVVLAIHAGGRCTKLNESYGPQSCDISGEIFKLLEAIPEKTFDVVIGGHVHSAIANVVRGTPVIESYAYGRDFGLVDLYVTKDGHHPVYSRMEGPVPICERVLQGTNTCDERSEKPGAPLEQATFHGQPVVMSAAVEALVAPFRERVAEVKARKLGVMVPIPLTREYRGEATLGDALTDTLRDMEKADVAILNSGGLRTDLPAGELTYGALYEVLPFDNTLATIQATGAQLAQLVAAGYGPNHGVMQVSGVKVKAERCGNDIVGVEITHSDGRALDPRAMYKVVTSDFLALGGDGLGEPMKSIPPERVDLGQTRPLNLREAMAEYLKSRGGSLVGHVDGRVIIESLSPEKCAARARIQADAKN